LNQFVVFDNEKMICYARAYPRNDFQSKPEANPGETQIYMNLHLVHNLFIRAQHRAPISKSRERGKTELVRWPIRLRPSCNGYDEWIFFVGARWGPARLSQRTSHSFHFTSSTTAGPLRRSHFFQSRAKAIFQTPESQ